MLLKTPLKACNAKHAKLLHCPQHIYLELVGMFHLHTHVSVCMYVCMYICPCVHWWPRPMREQWIRKGHRFFQWLRWHGDLAARLNGGALVTLMKIPNSEFQWAVSRHRERRLRPWHTASKLGPSGHNFGCTPPPNRAIHPSIQPATPPILRPLFGARRKCNRMQRAWNSTQNLQNATDASLSNQCSERKRELVVTELSNLLCHKVLLKKGA